MDTRRMNTRITFYKKVGGQNEYGEVLKPKREDVYSCCTEVQQPTVKDFRTGGKSYTNNGQQPLESFKDTKVFLIRYHPKLVIDNSMYIEFENFEYKITETEVDYANKDYIMIKGVRIS